MVKQKLDLLRKHFNKEELDKLVVLESFIRIQNHNQSLLEAQSVQEEQCTPTNIPKGKQIMVD